jgi:hypothetical protein
MKIINTEKELEKLYSNLIDVYFMDFDQVKTPLEVESADRWSEIKILELLLLLIAEKKITVKKLLEIEEINELIMNSELLVKKGLEDTDDVEDWSDWLW